MSVPDLNDTFRRTERPSFGGISSIHSDDDDVIKDNFLTLDDHQLMPGFDSPSDSTSADDKDLTHNWSEQASLGSSHHSSDSLPEITQNENQFHMESKESLAEKSSSGCDVMTTPAAIKPVTSCDSEAPQQAIHAQNLYIFDIGENVTMHASDIFSMLTLEQMLEDMGPASAPLRQLAKSTLDELRSSLHALHLMQNKQSDHFLSQLIQKQEELQKELEELKKNFDIV